MAEIKQNESRELNQYLYEDLHDTDHEPRPEKQASIDSISSAVEKYDDLEEIIDSTRKKKTCCWISLRAGVSRLNLASYVVGYFICMLDIGLTISFIMYLLEENFSMNEE